MPRDVTAPTISIVSPSSTTTYLSNTTTTITVNANDVDTGVKEIAIDVISPYRQRITIGGNLFPPSPGTQRSLSAQYTFDYLGTYTIVARAIDKNNNVAFANVTVIRSNTLITTTPSGSPVLPKSFICNTPTAFNQGGEGSCEACTCALIFTVTYYYHTLAANYDESINIFSPEYLVCKQRQQQFDQNGCFNSPGVGASSLIHLVNAKNTGCCRWNILPYSQYPYGCQTDPDTRLDVCAPPGTKWPGDTRWPGNPCHPCLLNEYPESVTDAANHKITQYAEVLSTDLYSVKRLLCNGHALRVAIALDMSLILAPHDPDWVWRTRVSDNASHAMTIIGYSDEKRAWLVQNSYGPDWGYEGKTWLDWTLVSQNASTFRWVTYRQDLNPYPYL